MSERVCPACHEDGAHAVETVTGLELVASYRSRGIDVSGLLDGQERIALYRCTSCDLHFFSPARAGDAGFYEQLQVHDWYYQDEKPEYPYAAALVEDGSSVLEVGCGKGAFRAWLPAGVEFTGLEFNDEAVRKAREAGLNVLKQPVEEHVAEGKRYDVVCAFQVLEHVVDPRSFFHACAQALNPGGKLIIAVPAQDSFLSIAANSPLNMPPHHLTRWTDRALTNLARREGLTANEVWHEPVASFHSEWHANVLAFHTLSTMGFIKPRLLDDSFRYRLLGRLLRVPTLRDYLARRALAARPEFSRGHTVMMVASGAPRTSASGH